MMTINQHCLLIRQALMHDQIKFLDERTGKRRAVSIYGHALQGPGVLEWN
jgi:hypothetical protein